MLEKITPELHCLVCKDRIRTAMFGRIGPEFHYLEGEGQNFCCLEALGQNSNVWKDKVKIEKFQRIGPEF